MLCMSNICSSAYIMREPAAQEWLYLTSWHSTVTWGRTFDLNFEASFAEQDSYFSSFLASNRTPMNYNRELFSRITEFITFWICAEHLNVPVVGGAKISLPIKRTLSNRRIFLTTKSDKCMRLLTTLYGITLLLHTHFEKVCNYSSAHF